MWKLAVLLGAVLLTLPSGTAARDFPSDVFETEGGKLTITFIGHGTLMFTFEDTIVHVDPVAQMADYTRMPKADIILVTHEHRDHFDPAVIEAISTDKTVLVLTEACRKQLNSGRVMRNGDVEIIQGISVEAVPAYNLVHMRAPGQPFHPRGAGNGYVITFGNRKVYVAGDTEDIPEMAELKGIDIAFLPMNLPYTMTPEMAARAAKSFKPRILYPYHFGETDTSTIIALLKDEKEIEVRIQPMK